MKRLSSFVASCAALLFALSGCGTDANELNPAVSSQSQTAASLTTTVESPQDPETTSTTDALGGGGGPTDPAGLGKRCYATCSVISVGTTSCPASMGGFGNTTFLGGCNKACRKAQGDAASKLPAGCVINTCNFSGC